jgi:O-antigen/teichoic acid export membrane protein
LILWVPGILGSVTLPMLSTFLAEGNASRYVRTLKVNLLINVAVGLAVALPISLAAPWIMAMYGRGFRDSWLALVALCFAGVLQGAGHVVGSALTSLGRMWWGFALNGIWAIEILTATVLLRHRGAIGLAEAYLISYVLHTLQTAVLTFVVLPRHIRRVGVRSETSCGG